MTKLKQGTQRSANQLRDLIRLFQSETVLRWHRQLVRRKWTYDQHNKGGRPPLDHELEALIVRLAQSNDRLAGVTIRSPDRPPTETVTVHYRSAKTKSHSTDFRVALLGNLLEQFVALSELQD